MLLLANVNETNDFKINIYYCNWSDVRYTKLDEMGGEWRDSLAAIIFEGPITLRLPTFYFSLKGKCLHFQKVITNFKRLKN